MVVDDGDGLVRGDARRVLRGREPEIDRGIVRNFERAVIRRDEDSARLERSAGEECSDAIGTRDRRREAEAERAQLGPVEQERRRIADFDDTIGRGEERIARRAQIPERRARAASPRARRVHREERERRAIRRELRGAVEHDDVRVKRRLVDRELLVARDEHGEPFARALDGFVSDDAYVVVRVDTARAPRWLRAIRVSDDRDAVPGAFELSRARDRERRATRTAERRAADAQDGTARDERTRRPREISPRARERRRDRRRRQGAPLERSLDGEPQHARKIM